MQKITLNILIILQILAVSSMAQVIPLKTIPVASGDQFRVTPSENLAMGNIGIALNDIYADPFINPAKGIRIDGVNLFSAPTFYNISNENGSARTLPFGVLVQTENWYGGFSFSIQQLQGRERFNFWPSVDFTTDLFFMPEPLSLNEQNNSNLYISGLLGTEISDNISLGASIFWAELEAVEGVDLLYPRSFSIEQSGNIADIRLGLLGKSSNQRYYEFLLLHSRYDMTHDVNYGFLFNELGRITGDNIEQNLDRTNTWGAHFGYVQPLNANDWQIGGILTVNRKDHPKIPNYDLVNIPRDPGNSWAFATGVGIARQTGTSTFGADLIFEPIWSHTWAEAAEPVQTVSGDIIPAGGRTIENDFQFRNWLFKMGIGHQAGVFGFQLGLQLRWIRYWLDQTNIVEGFDRSQRESWAEWTPGIGFNLNFPDFNIRYTGRFTTGTGQPGVAFPAFAADAALANSDIIAAPGGPLTLQEALVFTHQFTLSVPLRK